MVSRDMLGYLCHAVMVWYGMVWRGARSLNCYRWPLSAVGRFRLGGQVWLGIENIKLKETENAVKQLPLKPVILHRVDSDQLGRFSLALKMPNRQNKPKNSDVIFCNNIFHASFHFSNRM